MECVYFPHHQMRFALTRVLNLLQRIRKITSSEFMNGNAVLHFVAARYEAHMTKIEKGIDPRLIKNETRFFSQEGAAKQDAAATRFENTVSSKIVYVPVIANRENAACDVANYSFENTGPGLLCSQCAFVLGP